MTIAEQLIAQGKAEGKAEGNLEGQIQAKRRVLLRLLQRKFGTPSQSAEAAITASRDRERLDRAIDLVLEADAIDQVLLALR